MQVFQLILTIIKSDYKLLHLFQLFSKEEEATGYYDILLN